MRAAKPPSVPTARSSSTRDRTPAVPRRTSSSSRNRRASITSIGATPIRRSKRRPSTPCGIASSAYLSEREAYALDCYVGADERYRMPVRVYSEFAWHSLFARHLFITPETPEPGFVPEFTVVDAALFQADPQRDGTRTSDVHPRQLRTAHDLDRRHEIRRRDQEVGLHRHELSAAAARHAADALLGQRRKRRRRRDLLRPLRNRQDDPFGRFAPSAHRRRRARLVGRRRLQLRRRLLREGHPPLTQGRARDLGCDAPLFDRPRKRRLRSVDARARRRLRGQDREHARGVSAGVHPEHRAGQSSAATRRRSSC